jgi:hypothetical protein
MLRPPGPARRVWARALHGRASETLRVCASAHACACVRGRAEVYLGPGTAVGPGTHRRRCLAGKRESESLVAEIDTGSENLVLPHVSAYGDLYDA